MNATSFNVLAESTRLRILDELTVSERNVGDLVQKLKLSQPAVSKHLKVLRDAGFVACRIDAQRRVYRISSLPFKNLDDWLEPYRRLWTNHIDALERHLDEQEEDPDAKGRL